MWYLVKWETQLHHVAAQTEEERRGHRSGWKTDLILVVRFSIVTNIRLMVLCNKTSSLCVWTESFDDARWCHYLKKRHQAVFFPTLFFSNIKKALKWAYLLISDLQPQVAIMSCDNVVTIAQAEWSQWTVFFVSYVRAHLFIYKRENM